MELFPAYPLVQVLLPKLRNAMSRKLATGTFQNTLPLNYRGGTRVQPIDSVGEEKAYEPSTGRVITTFACSGEKEVNEAIQSAKAAFKIWSQKSGMERGRILLEAARIIRERSEELAAMETINNGKSIFEARVYIEMSWLT